MTSMARAAVLKDRQVEIALVSANVVLFVIVHVRKPRRAPTHVYSCVLPTPSLIARTFAAQLGRYSGPIFVAREQKEGSISF